MSPWLTINYMQQQKEGRGHMCQWVNYCWVSNAGKIDWIIFENFYDDL